MRLGCSRRHGLLCLASLSLFAGGCPGADAGGEVASAGQSLGEPQDGFPSWAERVVHVWTNRARCDPQADLASCSSCAEKACYAPRPPLAWSHNLSRAARFHADNLVRAGCSLQHDSPCALVSDLSSRYTPGPCDGSPACACTGGTAACGSTGTAWSSRVALFGTSPSAENISRGRTDPVSTFYGWLHEADSSAACGWRISNGHRANILGGSRSLGVGQSSSTYTQDFAGSGSVNGLAGGVHYPATGTPIELRANWSAASAPASATVNVGGVCVPMSLERGTGTNGTYLVARSVAAGCTRYYFHFTDGAQDHFYPTTGSFGINCAGDWESTRPAGACGGTPRPDAGAADASAWDAAAPDAASRDAAAPDAAAPDATAPDATAPDAAAPDATVPDAAAPDATAPDAWVPDAPAPDADGLDAEASDAPAPDAAASDGDLTPDAATPDALTSVDAFLPDVRSPTSEPLPDGGVETSRLFGGAGIGGGCACASTRPRGASSHAPWALILALTATLRPRRGRR